MAEMGIILINTGSPDAPTPEAVRSYLAEFLMDPRIVPMNRTIWKFILNMFILPRRSVRSARRYESIWTEEGSPLLVAHDFLANAMQARLGSDGMDVRVRSAMSYGQPNVEMVLRELMDEGVQDVLFVPTYPQSAHSTVGAVSDSVDRAMAATGFEGESRIIRDYHDSELYGKALAQSLLDAGFEVDSDDRVLFSYHSVPLKDLAAGDTYDKTTASTSAAVADILGIPDGRWTSAYQSRFDNHRRWLSPYTGPTLSTWAHEAPGRVFLITPNFAVDCLETLYELVYEIKPAYLDERRAVGTYTGDDDMVIVPCLDKSDGHVDVLVDVVRPWVESRS